MPSAVPALIDYLIAGLTTAGAAASPPFVVYDGPQVTAANDKLILWVGVEDPNSASPAVSGTFNQTRGDLGNMRRTEDSEIRCAAEAWAGTDDAATTRHQAFAIVTAVENFVRADTSRFGGSGQANPGVTGGTLTQDATQQGAVSRVQFGIIFKSFT